MKSKQNKKIKILLVFSGIIFLLCSCVTTKYVPEDERLLSKVEIKNPSSSISKQEIKTYVRQQENLKILGFWKFNLGIYNLSGKKEKKINNWLKKIGEAPVIFDPSLVDKSVSQMTLFLNNQGYYLAEVTDTIRYPSKKKAKVTYKINAGHRYRIKDVFYRIEDDSIKSLILNDSVNSLLRRGRAFTVNLHDQERERITRMLNNQGFYGFSKEYINFELDSMHGNYLISDTLVVENYIKQYPDDNEHHTKYSIREVIFHVGGSSQDVILEGITSFQFTDTLNYQGFKIVYNNKLDFKPNVLINSNYINPGNLYRIDLVERTHLLLSSLRIFRYININFRVIEGVFDKNGNKQIDCIIHLIQSDDKSHAFDIEGTNSSGNFGAAGSFTFQHKNIFKGAELFSISARIAQQDQFIYKSQKLFNTIEAGGEASILFPKFLLPIRIERFRQRYNPYTNLSLSYNYQQRPDYTRTIANARMAYSWRASRTTAHNFSLFDFNYVDIPHISTEFKSRIDSTFLYNIYQNHLILSTNYTITYSHQTVGRYPNLTHIRYNIEAAGNLLNLFMPLISTKSEENYYRLFGVRYAQYIKNEIDITFHNRLNRLTSIIYHFFAGVGIPYGNLDILPFAKRYFSGGAYSLRAWTVRGIGPGFVQIDHSNFYNQTADLRLEANLEYRFKLFWILEGAFFLDAGNIWDIRKRNARDEGLFKFDEFYKQIALGTGFGTRFDFKFFLFRIDFGLKIYDPSVPQGIRWRPARYSRDDYAFNFGIGYPF